VHEIFRFGPFELDTGSAELRKRDRRLRLSASLTKLLTYFVTRPGELITRQQIADCLWDEPQYVDTTSGINTAVNRLRAALDDDPATPIYIETSIGLGYRFVSPVERLSPPTQVDASPEDTGLLRHASKGHSGEGVTTVDEPIVSGYNARAPQERGMTPSSPPLVVRFDPTRSKKLEEKPESPQRHPWRWAGGMLLAVLLVICGLLSWRSHQKLPFHQDSEVFPSSHTEFSQVTFVDGGTSMATISHDGRMIAFGDRNGISVRVVDREVDRRLLSPTTLAVQRLTWLPGDNTLLASGKEKATDEEQVWLIFLGSGPSRLLLNDATEAVASPEGRRIAFTRHRGSEIWLSDEYGGSQRRLLTSSEQGSFSSLMWAPDGKRLVCQMRHLPIDSVPTNGAPIEEERHYRWEYASLDAHTGKILAQEPNVRFESAYFSRDGRMYFPESVDNVRLRSRLLMVKTEATTGRFTSEPRPVSQLDGYSATSLSASDSGDQIAAVFERYSTAVYVARIHSPDQLLADVRRLIHPAPDNYPHAWTPSGDAVIFESDSLGKYSIFKQRLDGSPAEPLARSIGGAVLPQVTPDGNWLLFENLKNFRPNAIFRTPIDGGELVQVPTSSAVQEFACSTSSIGSCVERQKIGNNFVYFALDPLTGQGKERGRTPWIENSLDNWSLSPDGNTIAMPIQDSANPGIRLLMLDTGKLSRTRDILVNGFGSFTGVSWASASGFYVESRIGTKHSLLFVDLEGHIKVLYQSDFATWGVPSRDGTKLALVDQVVDTNVWLARRIAP